MSDLLRMTGMFSGMDTESVIQQLVQVKAQKVTTLKNDQKKLEWKQDLWQNLNKRIYKLYTGTLSNMRLTGSYAKKSTKISDPNKATIVASDGAVNGSQSLEINKLAKAGYLTGAVLSKTAENSTKLSELGVTGGKLKVDIKDASGNTTTETIDVDPNQSINSFMRTFNSHFSTQGVTMSYNDGKISLGGMSYVESYTLTSADPADKSLLKGLGLESYDGQAQTKPASGGATVTGKSVHKQKSEDFTSLSLVSDINSNLIGKKIKLTVGKGVDAKETEIEITEDMKISDLVSKLKEGGVNASFDEHNQRFFIASGKTGLANEFSFNGTSNDVLTKLGLNQNAAYENGSKCTRIAAEDAEIVLNGATFTSDTNTFSVNGLSITAQAVTDTDNPVTITTDTDYDGIYNMIKDFITEYNDIMNEVTKLYNADSARKYTMLSDDEKQAMSDDEVEKWESTIKDSLLRKDKDLYSVMECMRGAINKGYEVGGKTLYLVNFGVGTGSYFETEKEERNALHIYGDSDDEKYADRNNDLKAAIAENPDQIIELFSAMSKDMYDSLKKTMGSTDYRSIYKVYDDKRLKSEYDDYTKKIKEAETKLNAYEDKWYKKFASMETALSKLQSNQNSLTSMLGQ